ncbi:MAG: DUF2782 domain-containing protein [Gammaproteobacteria bacterium]|nr:DUF2782 domain-containing protein [Gammaproteobacteria bacterium]
MRRLAGLILLSVALTAVASDEESSGAVIIEGSSSEIVQELRVNGQLYAVRITPKKGYPYYLVDSDGDGNLETRNNDLGMKLLIPTWVLKSW